MAPIRTSGSLKQGTLKFSSAKRTASTSTAGKPKKAVRRVSTPLSESSSPSSSGSERSGTVTPVIEISAGSLESSKAYKRQKEDEASTVGLRPAKRRHVSPFPEVASTPSRGTDEGLEAKEQRPSLDPKDRRWRKLHTAAKKRMDYATPVHAENQNKIHEILRIFDLSYEYGPCIGVSRLERWERAHAMGLNPPQEIREILDTLEGREKSEYSQCVFYDAV